MSDTADQHDRADGSASSGAAATAEDAGGRNPALIAAAVALPLMVLAGVIVFAVLATRSPALEPVVLGAAEAPEAESEQCTELIAAVPEDLADLTRAEIVEPVPAGTAAWQDPDDPDADPVVLRCGLDRPHEFVQNSRLESISNVEWLEVDGTDDGLESSTWTAVDRGVYIALTLPTGSGTGPIQVMSKTIADTLPVQELDPAPARDLGDPLAPADAQD